MRRALTIDPQKKAALKAAVRGSQIANAYSFAKHTLATPCPGLAMRENARS
jgi:hypothetical protein